MQEYSETTTEHISSLTLEERKKLGQYMTPQSIGRIMAAMLTTDPTNNIKVLDPSAGTGELLTAYKHINPEGKYELNGWDIDNRMLTVLNRNLPEAKTRTRSLFLPITETEKASIDVIIGNPPYFEIRKNSAELQQIEFETAEEAGRINMYSLFFEYSLQLLKEGGELIFLVPPSMNNGRFFKKLRTHILTNSYIKNLTILRDNRLFSDALTSAQIIHLIKRENSYQENLKESDKFLFDFNKVNPNSEIALPTIFTDNKQEIERNWENSSSLNELGIQVKTGSTLWNKNKERFLTNESEHTAPLIYSKDISKTNEYEPAQKLNERRHLPKTNPGLHTEPSIIVNRIVGALSNPQLRHAHITLNEYFTENHINVVTLTPKAQKTLEALSEHLNEHSMEEYLKALTGNTQLSSTELKYMIPFPKAL